MSAIDVQAPVRFERILLPTECTGETTVALHYAVGLCRQFSSHLELTNVIDLSRTFPTLDVLSGPALDALRRTGEEDLRRVAAGLSGVSFTKRVVEGFEPSILIVDEAVNCNADLIILGTNCRRGLTNSSLGSRVEAILGTAPCPILTIGPRVLAPPEGAICFQRILYATDFSYPARKAAGIALSLGQCNGAKVYLCHVVTKKEQSHFPGCDEASIASLKALVPGLAEDCCSAECVVEHGKAADGILSLANRVNADLIVLGAHKHSFWLDFLHSGITAAVLAAARCPVLTVSGLQN